MILPATLSHTLHRVGGRVLIMRGIAHTIATPRHGKSFDECFYIGDVMRYGQVLERMTIRQGYLAHDGDPTELQALADLMQEYMSKNGAWFDTGRHKGWYATQRGEISA